MAAGATTTDFAVVEVGRFPGVGGMATFAVIAAVDMIFMFTFGDAAIVAGGAGPYNLAMINAGSGCPACVSMA